MDTRNQSRTRRINKRVPSLPRIARRGERGATALQVLVILVPVIFGLIGFAIDLGQLYLAKGELKTAANTMALAAAQKLIGTDQGLAAANANLMGQLTLAWDDGTTSREAIVQRLAKAGFPELAAV